MPNRSEIIATARTALDTPFRHQGRVGGRGLDCVGLVLYTVRTLPIIGLEDYEPPPYQRSAKWGEFLQYFQNNLVEVDRLNPQAGDVICFRQEKYPCHCGIMTGIGQGGRPRFIHAYMPRRKVVEEEYTVEWRKLTRAVFAFPGVED